MTQPDIPALLSSINLQIPHITSESLHFILQGYRSAQGADAADDVNEADEAEDARLLLKRVKSLRDSLHAASTEQATDGGQDAEILHLDYMLAETERDLATALHKMDPAHTGKQPRR